jgi:hypothetical protein
MVSLRFFEIQIARQIRPKCKGGAAKWTIQYTVRRTAGSAGSVTICDMRCLPSFLQGSFLWRVATRHAIAYFNDTSTHLEGATASLRFDELPLETTMYLMMPFARPSLKHLT